ncbi:MAG: hypothetical protein LBU43_05700 [Candidatus Accumulibacter sp.]|jgi:hypothetical protein|nr:hypothetical protein [Accumulibacter sp.]
MSNPAVVFLSKIDRDGLYFAVEDNIGEAIHIHLANRVVNIRLDLTIKDFLVIADQIKEALDDLLDGKARCCEFDNTFLFTMSRYLPDLENITYDTVMIEDIIVDNFVDGNILLRPITDAWVGKAMLKDDSGENDTHGQINYLSNQSLSTSNRERVDSNYNRIKTQGGFGINDCVTFFFDSNCIRDGQHRAVSLYKIKGNCPVPCRRLWFREGKYKPFCTSDLEKRLEQSQTQNNNLQTLLEQSQTQNNNLQTLLEQSRAGNAALLSSRSWKISAPFRAVKRLLGK